MVDTQHFCLRWNNYQSSITSAFENLRDDEDFVDVTLACDGKSLKAHRVVLSACSPYFRELLKSTPCKHPVIVLQDVAWTDLHALVEFIYHGEVNVHQRSLSSFLKTAEVLRVSGLTQQHGDARDQLAQVQNMVRSQHVHQSSPIANHHHPSFAEKLVEDALFPSRSSPPHGGGGGGGGSNVNQLLRRAVAMQYRRERRISIDPDGEQHKRARGGSSVAEHLLGASNNNNNNNNNNELNLSHTHPPQTQPADFSPSGMKNNALNLNLNSHVKNEIEGNGISSTGDRDRSPCSPSPTGGLHPSDPSGLNLKSEPMEMLCPSGVGDGGGGVDSDDSTAENGTASDTMGNGPHAAAVAAAAAAAAAGLPQGPHSGSSGGGVGGGGVDHDDRDSAISPYLTATESKLFATATESKLFATAAAAGGFNFSMAALTGDPAALGLNQSLQGNDSLAGTSQGGVHGGLAAAAADDFRCQPCNKSLSSLTRLKRHIQNVHMRPSREPVCNICKRVYSSLNSLRNHKSIYHRNVKAVAKAEDVMAAAAAAAAAHSFYL